MKYGLKMLALSLLATGFVATTFAAEDTKYKAAKQNVENVLGFQVLSIGDSPIDGLAQVSTNRGLFYTSADGKFLVSGKIFNVSKGMRDETEASLADMRVEGISDFNDSYIEFKAPDEKYVVNVFTDITCGYCRKLHREMDQYMANGITVRYLAFPRGGINSRAYGDMVSVWCSEDQQEAMTVAKTGGSIEQNNCANSVAQQYAFGQRVGVTGTPNIILPNGTMVPGYQPASDLLNTLNNI